LLYPFDDDWFSHPLFLHNQHIRRDRAFDLYGPGLNGRYHACSGNPPGFDNAAALS
jgi:hypothetical protein